MRLDFFDEDYADFLRDNARGIETATCLDCGRDCEVVYEDEGIGVTEAWGVNKNDVQICAASLCCGASVM